MKGSFNFLKRLFSPASPNKASLPPPLVTAHVDDMNQES